MKLPIAASIVAASLLAIPSAALADFSGQSARAQANAAALTQEQLDNLNSRVITDAYLTARIIGYDPAEIRTLRSEVAQLRRENTELRASFGTLETTLKLVVTMLTALLAKF